MFFVCVLTFYFVSTLQTSHANCLRDNSGLLDAEFSFFNKLDDFTKVTKEDVEKHVALFSTRFQRWHEFLGLDTDLIKVIGDGLSLYKNNTRKEFKVFVRYSRAGISSDLNEGIQAYKEVYEILKNINSGDEGPVMGLYVGPLLDTYPKELEALESVFGSSRNSSFQIGLYSIDCFGHFQNEFSRKLMWRQDFINCKLDAGNKSFPEESANEVIDVCSKLKEFATSVNVTATITCSVSYPSLGTSSTGIIGSVFGFQRFWCKIVNEVAQKKYNFKIIMQSAFDVLLADYRSNETNLYDGKYHTGWWRRRHTTSYEASAFVEKVVELEGGNEHQNCNKECGFCSSSKECGPGRLCYRDPSFQPFEYGPSPTVCLSVFSFCAPRPPNASTTPSSCLDDPARSNAIRPPKLSDPSVYGGVSQVPLNNLILVFVLFNCIHSLFASTTYLL